MARTLTAILTCMAGALAWSPVGAETILSIQIERDKIEIKRNGDFDHSVVANNVEVIKDDESHSVHMVGFFDVGSYRAFLIQKNSGGTACPSQFVLIVSGTNTSMTKPFGNCTDTVSIRVHQRVNPA